MWEERTWPGSTACTCATIPRVCKATRIVSRQNMVYTHVHTLKTAAKLFHLNLLFSSATQDSSALSNRNSRILEAGLHSIDKLPDALHVWKSVFSLAAFHWNEVNWMYMFPFYWQSTNAHGFLDFFLEWACMCKQLIPEHFPPTWGFYTWWHPLVKWWSYSFSFHQNPVANHTI